MAEEQDLYNYLKRNLIGFTSDGSTVMKNTTNGLISHFREFANRPIYAAHCMSHRLHLAIVSSFKSNNYFVEFEHIINEIYELYSSYKPKRRDESNALCRRIYEAMAEFNYIFDRPSIISQWKVLNSIKNVWPLIVQDLVEISSNSRYDIGTQEMATRLCNKLKGKYFLLILNFILDILHHLWYWADNLQKRTGLLIDLNEINKKMRETFESLKIVNGRDVDLFLKTAKCANSQSCNTLEMYQQSAEITYINIKLLSDHETNYVPWLQTIRESFLNNLIEELNSYYPSGDLDVFDVFSPAKIPRTESELISYGEKEIQSLCTFFAWNECNRLILDWTILIHTIMNSDRICEIRNSNTNSFVFWTQFLKTDGIAWTERTQKLIFTILVLPIGSADIQRGFSIMNTISKTQRLWLFPKHIDASMRIQINGPDQLDRFSATKYANEWNKTNHMRTIQVEKDHANHH